MLMRVVCFWKFEGSRQMATIPGGFVLTGYPNVRTRRIVTCDLPTSRPEPHKISLSGYTAGLCVGKKA